MSNEMGPEDVYNSRVAATEALWCWFKSLPPGTVVLHESNETTFRVEVQA